VVLGAGVKLLTNPLVLRMAVVFVSAAVAFLVGFFAIRQLRHGLREDALPGESSTGFDNFPLHTYHAVIQQLKQQKHELQALQQSERRRAQTTENLSAAVLSNLSCGVLFFNSSALVRQANAAAKNILGIASPVGMSPRDLFRDASVQGGLNSARTPLWQAVANSLQGFSKFECLEAIYTTPQGDERTLEVTLSPVYGGNAEVMGAACLLNDCTEIARMRRNQDTVGTISPEIVRELEGSLGKISSLAKDLESAKQEDREHDLGAQIAAEADLCVRKLSSALSGRNMVGTAAGRN
jgi:PAS domain-containing protein